MANYHNQKLLDLARECPHCMNCGTLNHGQVVGCHSNKIKHGKGMGIKSHDLVAYLCPHCHDYVDGRSSPKATQDERDACYFEAVYKSVVWLLQEGWISLNKAHE